MNPTRLSPKIALLAGLVLPGCGATSSLPEQYPPTPVVADAAVAAGICGIPVACGTPRLNDPCSITDLFCAAGVCPGRCELQCIPTGRNGCKTWRQPDIFEGPLPPPESLV